MRPILTSSDTSNRETSQRQPRGRFDSSSASHSPTGSASTAKMKSTSRQPSRFSKSSSETVPICTPKSRGWEMTTPCHCLVKASKEMSSRRTSKIRRARMAKTIKPMIKKIKHSNKMKSLQMTMRMEEMKRRRTKMRRWSCKTWWRICSTLRVSVQPCRTPSTPRPGSATWWKTYRKNWTSKTRTWSNSCIWLKTHWKFNSSRSSRLWSNTRVLRISRIRRKCHQNQVKIWEATSEHEKYFKNEKRW